MKEVPLSARRHHGLVTLVDDDVYDQVIGISWSRMTGGSHSSTDTVYAHGRRPDTGQWVNLHNYICELKGLPKSPDHINRNGLDNRVENFRFGATGTQQQGNKRLNRNNTSGLRGVRWRPNLQKWEACLSLRIDGKSVYKYLGRHDTREDAGRAYNKAALEHFGEYAALNCVNGVPL